jgi:creatinine amidohydrolase
MLSNQPTQNIFTNTMADMKWTDIKRYAEEDAIVLLPMGVIEEHGPHLCLATDIYTAHIYCNTVKQKLEEKGYSAVIAPPFYWGICQAGRGFIGSFNIRLETAEALLFDILSSLKEFGFKRVFGVNTHGDIEHQAVAMNAFKKACEQLEICACFPFQEFMFHHFGLNSDEPCFYVIKPQEIKVSKADVWDVHAGDMETGTINTYYPHLVDTEIAKLLPDVALGDQFEAWMFGGQLKQISPQGYLGSPSCYDSINIPSNVEDNAHRITDAILTRLNRNGDRAHD